MLLYCLPTASTDNRWQKLIQKNVHTLTYLAQIQNDVI